MTPARPKTSDGAIPEAARMGCRQQLFRIGPAPFSNREANGTLNTPFPKSTVPSPFPGGFPSCMCCACEHEDSFGRASVCDALWQAGAAIADGSAVLPFPPGGVSGGSRLGRWSSVVPGCSCRTADRSGDWCFRRERTAAPTTIAAQTMTRRSMKMSSAGTRVPLRMFVTAGQRRMKTCRLTRPF